MKAVKKTLFCLLLVVTSVLLVAKICTGRVSENPLRALSDLWLIFVSIVNI